MAILDAPLNATPVAIVDLETTGLSPKIGARVVELAVVRIDPGYSPALVLDTLVDPEGPVLATRIHGISDEDVVGAPLFSELAGELLHAVSGAVVAAFNASFDMGFIAAELERARRRIPDLPPYLCVMYLRPLLGIGDRCSLAEACASLGLPPGTHRASDDARLTAALWERYREHAVSRGLRTFGISGR